MKNYLLTIAAGITFKQMSGASGGSRNSGRHRFPAALRYMVQAVEDAIQDGRSVDMGIGTLSPAISTKAAEDEKDVKVVRKRVLFRASKHLRTIVQNMSVRLIGDEDDGTTDTAPDDDSSDYGSSDSSEYSDSSDAGSSGGGSHGLE